MPSPSSMPSMKPAICAPTQATSRAGWCRSARCRTRAGRASGLRSGRRRRAQPCRMPGVAIARKRPARSCHGSAAVASRSRCAQRDFAGLCARCGVDAEDISRHDRGNPRAQPQARSCLRLRTHPSSDARRFRTRSARRRLACRTQHRHLAAAARQLALLHHRCSAPRDKDSKA